MLDGVDPGADRVLDARVPDGVTCRPAARVVRCPGDRLELVRLQRGLRRGDAGREHPAGRHGLDEVRAFLDLGPGRRADPVRPVGFPADEVAVAAGHGDDAPGGQDARPGHQAVLDGTGQLDHDAVGRPAVPDRGDAGVQGQLQVKESSQRGHGRTVRPGLREQVRRPVMAQVHVAVDEAGQQRPPVALDDGQPLATGQPAGGSDPGDPAAFDDHGLTRNRRAARAVHQVDVADREGRLLSHALLPSAVVPMMSSRADPSPGPRD